MMRCRHLLFYLLLLIHPLLLFWLPHLHLQVLLLL
jgi:hypothetical protein